MKPLLTLTWSDVSSPEICTVSKHKTPRRPVSCSVFPNCGGANVLGDPLPVYTISWRVYRGHHLSVAKLREVLLFSPNLLVLHSDGSFNLMQNLVSRVSCRSVPYLFRGRNDYYLIFRVMWNRFIHGGTWTSSRSKSPNTAPTAPSEFLSNQNLVSLRGEVVWDLSKRQGRQSRC